MPIFLCKWREALNKPTQYSPDLSPNFRSLAITTPNERNFRHFWRNWCNAAVLLWRWRHLVSVPRGVQFWRYFALRSIFIIISVQTPKPDRKSVGRRRRRSRGEPSLPWNWGNCRGKCWKRGSSACVCMWLTYEGWFFERYNQAITGLFPQKYSSNWGHMKALNMLIKMRYGSLLSSWKQMSGRAKCWGNLQEASTTQKYA